MSDRPIQVGDRVSVVSGPHEGRGGFVQQIREIVIEYRDPEPYAIVEYPDGSVAGGKDSISVPTRRLKLR